MKNKTKKRKSKNANKSISVSINETENFPVNIDSESENPFRSLEVEKEYEHCIYPRKKTSFSSVEELTLSGENTLLAFLKRLNRNFKLPKFESWELEEAVPLIRHSFKFYLEASWEKVPELFYSEPTKVPLICVSSPIYLSDGEVSDLTFKSSFEPRFPSYKKRLISEPLWNSVRAKYWRHTDGSSKGTVIAVHGWMMGDEKASALTLVPGFFYRMGLDVILYELPLHGFRKPEDLSPIKMFPSIDPACTNESFAQAIYELRSIREWLRQNQNKPVVGVGLSLGAQTIALWGSFDRLDAMICAAPLVSLSDFIWKQVDGSVLVKHLKEAGITKRVLEQGYAVSSPLSYNLATPNNLTMIVAGKNDQIVSSEQASKLHAHWDSPLIHWLSEGHIEQLVAKETGEKIHDFLFDLGLALKDLKKVRKSKI